MQLSMGVVRIGWVWLERCRDGSYAVNALHCDVCSLCMPSGVHGCLFHWFLGGSASLHDWFFALFGKVLFL